MEKMMVKDIILAAAGELGLYDTVYKYMSGNKEVGEAETSALLRCFNLVENELALDYLPLYAEEEMETETGAVYYSELSRPAVRIVKVMDEGGNDAPFRLFPEYVKTQGGRVKIRYTYAPEQKELGSESDYMLQASLRLFAYGIAAEYSLSLGLFEEAAVWDKKYKDAITAAYRSKPSVRMRSRRWA